MLKYMNYLYEVHRYQSFSKAARALFVSQPSLSSIVKKTEEDLGVQIFDRSTNPISLTEAGELYILTITKMMEMEKELRERCAELAAAKESSFRIGAPSYFCTYVLPDLISDFETLSGRIHVIPFEANTDDLTEALQTGVVDLCINTDTQDPLLFERRIWKQEHVILAVPSSFSVNETLKDRQLSVERILDRSYLKEEGLAVSAAHFAHEPFLFMKKGNDMYQRGMQICRNAGFRPEIIMYLDQLLTSFYIAADGRGVCFLRDELLRYVPQDQRLCFYRVDDPLETRDVCLYYRKKELLRQPVKEFLEFLAGS